MPDDETQLVLDKIQKLIDAEIGSSKRLDKIKNTLEQGQLLSDEDEEYFEKKCQQLDKIDTSIHENVTQNVSDTEKNISELTSTNSFQYRGSNNYKSEGSTLVLSLLFGLLGFLGIGHRYIGDITKSLVLLYSGWALLVLNTISLSPIWTSLMGSLSPSFSYPYYGFPLADLLKNAGVDYGTATLIATVLMIAGPIGYYFLLIWQIFNARTICRKFNQFMDNSGKQLYEMTIIRKVIWIVIFLAPLILFVISFTSTLFPS